MSRRWIIFALLAADAAFLALLPFPAGQGMVFRYIPLCDFRMFIAAMIKLGITYFPSPNIRPEDACYPPIVYDLVNFLFGGLKGHDWTLSGSECGLVVSIATLQFLGIITLVRRPLKDAVAIVFVALLSPAFLCPILRGNPVGWSFAFVCFYLLWHDSPRRGLRILAAGSLAMAAALKITPCIYGLLYVCFKGKDGMRIDWKGIALSAAFAVVLVFVPFAWHGGFAAIGCWVSNALTNSACYSCRNPIWGFVPFVLRLSADWPTSFSLQTMNVLTKLLTVALVVAVPFVRNRQSRLLFLGSAMAFLTYHDYGALYLLPAFVARLREPMTSLESKFPAVALLDGVCWILIFMPLQIPLFGSLNEALQGEAHLLVLALGLIRMVGVRSFCSGYSGSTIRIPGISGKRDSCRRSD